MEILIMIVLLASPSLVTILINKRVYETEIKLGIILVGLYVLVSMVVSVNNFQENVTQVDLYPITMKGVVTERDHYINEDMKIVVNLGDVQKAIVVDEIIYGNESKLVRIDYLTDEESFPNNIFLTLEKVSINILKLKLIN